MKLADCIGTRDNNFNLLRMLACIFVIVTHSYALTGDKGVDPLFPFTRYALSGLAVDLFFIASGFLIMASLMAGNSVLEYFWARFLRIWPGLAVAVFFSIGLCAAFTTLPLPEYFQHENTREFITDNLSLRKVEYNLPGVFTDHPSGAVNGSLWTLVWEVRLYFWLGVIGFTLKRWPRVLLGVVLSVAVYYTVLHLAGHYRIDLGIDTSENRSRCFSLFFAGASYYLLRHRIHLDYRWLALAAAVPLASALFSQHKIFYGTYWLVFPYVVFCLAYLPKGKILQYNRLGDYSYGMYIYAFPVQQAIYALVPGVTTWQMFALACLCTLPLAVLSWHVLEEHMLGYKKVFRKKRQ